jgi:hypothetical protein
MMMSVDIEVTQEAIVFACKASDSQCMIANAIRASEGRTRIEVDLATIRWTEKGKRRTWLTPPVAQRALVAFDQGDEIEPFTLRLHHPAQVVNAPSSRRLSDGKVKDRTKAVTTTSNGPEHAPTIQGGKSMPRAPLNNAGPPNITLGQKKVAGRERRYGIKQLRP